MRTSLRWPAVAGRATKLLTHAFQCVLCVFWTACSGNTVVVFSSTPTRPCGPYVHATMKIHGTLMQQRQVAGQRCWHRPRQDRAENITWRALCNSKERSNTNKNYCLAMYTARTWPKEHPAARQDREICCRMVAGQLMRFTHSSYPTRQ
jgi:hypothetical protein